MTTEYLSLAKSLVQLSFQEDFDGRGDITTEAICQQEVISQARIIAKQEGIVCGLEAAGYGFLHLDENIDIHYQVSDGERVENQQTIMTIKGKIAVILRAERTALNFLGRLSGIATMTNSFVQKIAFSNARILDTRKTTPGWRFLEKYAVRCGGGENHRFGLYDMFLIKENHITQAGGIKPAVLQCHSFMNKHQFKVPIEVEVKTIDQVREALDLQVNRIMLDNMSIGDMEKAVKLVNRRTELEASGNVSLKDIEKIAATGVDYISIGALTHSFPVFDFSLLL